jgi:hypothetical protein
MGNAHDQEQGIPGISGGSMSTGGSVDERIRAVLDLGDSSGVVRALDREVEQLLTDFQKQTELFDKGQLSSKDYTAALNKMKSEVSGLSGAMKDLGGGGGGGGGDSFETINRKLFALERGMTNLVGGTGLGRAGGLLETGINLFGGPAGLGFAVAMFANTLDNILPKLEGFWAHLWNQLTADEVQEKLKDLAEQGKKAKESLDAIFARPAPGQEKFLANQVSALQGVFNAATGRAGLEQGVQSVLRQGGLRGHWEESSEVQELRKQQAAILSASETPEDPHVQTLLLNLENQIKKLVNQNIERRASELMLEAQKEGPGGRRARKELIAMIRDHPDFFKGAGALVDKLQKADEEPYRPPTPEAIDQDRQERLERAERQFGRVGRLSQQRALQFTIESDGLEFIGPPEPSRRQLLANRRRGMERRRLRRQRRELPEGQAGPPKPPLDRGKFAAQPHPGDIHVGVGPEQRGAAIARMLREDPNSPWNIRQRQMLQQFGRQTHEFLGPPIGPHGEFVGPPDPSKAWKHAQKLKAEREEALSRPSVQRALTLAGKAGTPVDTAGMKYREEEKTYQDFKVMQANALEAQHQGLATQAKTQALVHMLQEVINTKIWPKLKQLDRDAETSLRRQQRTQQNTTGRP